MKKFIKSGTWALFIFCAWSCANRNTLYVSQAGDDANPGTRSKPLKSLYEAMRRGAAMKSTHPDRQLHILLRAGTYPVMNTIRIGAALSGSEKTPTIIRAFKKEAVFLTGAIDVPLADVGPIDDPLVIDRLLPHVRDKVRQIGLKGRGIGTYGEFGPRGFSRPYTVAPNELFINGKPQVIARWPNAGEQPIHIGEILDRGSVPRNGDFSKRGGVFKWNTDRPERWSKAKDVYITGLFRYGYADDAIRLAKIDQEEHTFTTDGPHIYGFDNTKPWNAWTAVNLLEEIDVPGEYFIDKTTEMLYFFPEDTINQIQVSVMDRPIISFINASEVVVEGITFEAARGMAVYIEGGGYCRIRNCTFRNLGLVAVCMGRGVEPSPNIQHSFTGEARSEIIGSLYSHLYEHPDFDFNAGKQHGIENCEIYNTGAGGIILSGGNRQTLDPGKCFVRNCHIFNFNRLDYSYKGAVNVQGVGNMVEHCEIHDAPRSAILLHGNDHVIEYNEIHHVMMLGDDQGAVYMGRDPSEFNNTFRYNYFHDIGIGPNAHSTIGIYLDDGACGSQIYGNVFKNTGTMGAAFIGGGKYNRVQQ